MPAWQVGRIFGIKVRVDSSWLIIFILISWSLAASYFPQRLPGQSAMVYWAMGIIAALLVFVSVVFHELAHSLVAIKSGEHVQNITLFVLGGVAQITEEPKLPRQELLMALAGPLASFVMAAIFISFSVMSRTEQPIVYVSTRYLAMINILLGVFNLLPGFPMDGGRVVRSLIWATTGNLQKATRIASRVGQAMSFLLILVGLIRFLMSDFGGLWFVLIGWFLHNAAVQSYDQVRIRTVLEGLKARDLMRKEYASVPSGLIVQSLVNDFILKKGERVFLVLDNNEIRGIVCLEDVRRSLKEDWPKLTVSQIMTPRDKLESVDTDEDGNAVLTRFVSKDIHQVPVFERGQLVGVICRSDLLKFLQLRAELGM